VWGKKIPTAAGKAIYNASNDVLNKVNDLKQMVEQVKGEIKGRHRWLRNSRAFTA